MATPGPPPDPAPYTRLTAGDLAVYVKMEWFVGTCRVPTGRRLPQPKEVSLATTRDGRLCARFSMVPSGRPGFDSGPCST